MVVAQDTLNQIFSNILVIQNYPKVGLRGLPILKQKYSGLYTLTTALMGWDVFCTVIFCCIYYLGMIVDGVTIVG